MQMKNFGILINDIDVRRALIDFYSQLNDAYEAYKGNKSEPR